MKKTTIIFRFTLIGLFKHTHTHLLTWHTSIGRIPFDLILSKKISQFIRSFTLLILVLNDASSRKQSRILFITREKDKKKILNVSFDLINQNYTNIVYLHPCITTLIHFYHVMRCTKIPSKKPK